MMFPFIKKNWVYLFLIGIIFFLVKDKLAPSRSTYPSSRQSAPVPALESFSAKSAVAPSDSAQRLVIQDTSLSLLVKDVAQSITQIETTAKDFGGFLVNSNLSKPEGAASGSITIRVPEDKRSTALNAFRQLSVKVVSEYVSGIDVTDQYQDIEARLSVLAKTKTKFEEIMAKAVNINDLLNVQRELISLQSQIDNLKGQQKYYEQSAKLTKITVYLSTDELALPYAPEKSWHPSVIFKQAVRSLVSSLRSLATLIIWLVVFLPIIIPILLIVLFLRHRFFPFNR